MLSNPAWWGVGLTATGGAVAWGTLIIKLLWNFRGKWDETNLTLAGLRDQIANLAAQDSRIEQRLERHLDWHDRH